MLDISDRVNSNQNSSEVRVHATVETAVEGVVTFNERGVILSFNPAAESMFGYGADEVIGQDVHLLMFAEQDHHGGDLNTYLSGGFNTQTGKREALGRRKDGSSLPLAISVIEIKVHEQRIFAGILRDLTEEKLAEEQALQLALEQEKVHILADFIKSMSHDLRTPLSIINTSLYLFRKQTDPEKQQQRINTIEDQVVYLAGLIDELLMMSRLDHTSEFTIHKVDLNRLVRMAHTGTHNRAGQKDISVELELQADLPTIDGDEKHLYTAIMNIIENALLYTPDGGRITLRTYQQDTHVILEALDTGMGIGEEDIPNIFDRFYKVNKARTLGQSRSGLGLAMVKKIVDLHQGSIEVQSQLGQGSQFRILIPIERSPK